MEMIRIHYIGHAGFMIEMPGQRLVFDPWVNGNPAADPNTIEPLVGADFVFVTHDHGDHGFEEAVEMCLADKKTTLVAIHELGLAAEERGVEKVVKGNLGGSTMIGKHTEVFFANAFHSCTLGSPCGFVVKTPELTVYHAGDTSYYSDMKYLARKYVIDLALLPIGSTYTMGPEEAVRAVAAIDPNVVIPMHYNTFDVIQQNPDEFVKQVGDRSRVEVMLPGSTLEL